MLTGRETSALGKQRAVNINIRQEFQSLSLSSPTRAFHTQRFNEQQDQSLLISPPHIEHSRFITSKPLMSNYLQNI